MVYKYTKMVAPFTGAWIEIAPSTMIRYKRKVAPFTGAWIEIAKLNALTCNAISRSLHGSVD